ncbi:tetratricopeptide repeat protein [Capnocytophaga leadbetteri]|jgi:tetratricopeptide repeat protein|uniref:tetratricopeptide repeat protein n=1 Tax=Capnocytophaga leadbetteri TaxID=327575 RepID=UPI0026F0DF7F|nr:tetratricopeptide repeat protein [Capnocytophaga leadbetteri]
MKYLITLIYLAIATIGWGQDQDNFDKATTLYQKGDYTQAAAVYSSILKSGKESSALYYNLGNTYYKLNNVPESIYYYEKALQLDPENADAKNNLIFANQMKVDAITPLPKTWVRQLSDGIVGLFSAHTWAVLSIIGVFAFVLSFLLYYFVERTALKRTFFSLMLAFLFFAIGSYTLAHFCHKQVSQTQYAILFDKTVRVFSDANAYSSEVMQLHEGTKVEIIEDAKDWVKIRLVNGKTGWTKVNSLRKL